MAGRLPPRYVPTLTEVVQSPPVPAGGEVAGVTQEQLVMRVMQRVDLALERRMREAIAAAVLEQARLLGPLLRDEIESVVRETVAQAFADELGRNDRSPSRDP
jgi:hypothetical protein